MVLVKGKAMSRRDYGAGMSRREGRLGLHPFFSDLSVHMPACSIYLDNLIKLYLIFE